MKKSTGVLCMVLCFFGSLFANGGQEAAGSKIKLKMWENEGVEKDFMLWAAEEFSKIHPNISIEYEPVSPVDARGKIELDGPAGVGADIFAAPHDHIGALITGGHILTHNYPNFTDDFVDAAVTAASYEGKIYGYPIAIETYALFYNKDIFKTPPKTWEEIEKFAQTWNDKAKNKYALAWEAANAYYSYIFMSGFGAPLFGPKGDNPAQHNVNSPAAITGLQYFQKLRKSVLDVPSADISADYCASSFIAGTVPLILAGPWKIAEFTGAKLNYGIAEIPVFPGQVKPPASFSGVRLLFVSAYSNHPKEAAAFAKFLCSKKCLEKRFQMTKQIPPHKKITVSDPLSKGILAQAKWATPMPSIPEMGRYWSTMNAAFAGIWDGQTVKTQLDTAAAAMETK